MSITLTLPESVAARLQTEARARQRSAAELAVELLDQALPGAVNQALEELMSKVSAKPPNPACVRPAAGSLADALTASNTVEVAANGAFDLPEWQRQWAAVEAEMKELERANDRAEGQL